MFEQYKESYYHTVIFLTFELLGFYIDAEVNTSRGRIDAVVKSKEAIFIFEFKVNETPQKAIEQIKEKKYADKYLTEKENGKTIFLLGVNFKNKTEVEYLVEEI
ncbi:PD-(D/E)XK nuclease domain-containing protein [Bernardetia sp. ABR2-2B]|uniref:PD-(D/E)XK nuclease domain-containing protein n=1 Tax=Bernardetia sp. ABR2-2B TaxID=3127472 RepID=UPI0030CD1522